MTTEERVDVTKVISMTQFEFQLELDKVRLEQKAIDNDLFREVKKMLIDKAKSAFCKAKGCVPYEECHRANGGCFAMQRFIKAMEE